MSTCVRPGCRKNATYAVTLERLHHPPAVLHQWLLCVDHRDAMQFEQFATFRAAETQAKPAVRRRATVPARRETPAETEKAQRDLDSEDAELRGRVAKVPEELETAPPDGSLMAKRGRAVASPPPE